MLKPIDKNDYQRVKALADEMSDRKIIEIPSVTRFRLFNTAEMSGTQEKSPKYYSMMPMFSVTLQPIGGVNEQTVSRFWEHLSQGLDALHSQRRHDRHTVSWLRTYGRETVQHCFDTHGCSFIDRP